MNGRIFLSFRSTAIIIGDSTWGVVSAQIAVRRIEIMGFIERIGIGGAVTGALTMLYPQKNIFMARSSISK